MAFHALANLVDLHDGYMQAFTVAGKRLLLIQEAGQTYLIEDRCPHMDAVLSTGSLAAGAVRCRAHGIEFDLSSGKARGPLGDTIDCLNRFELSFEGNKVGVVL